MRYIRVMDFLVKFSAVLFSLALVLFIWSSFSPKSVPVDVVNHNLPIVARAGEWITNPDGSKVCRLNIDLHWAMTMRSSYCSDWQGEPAHFGETVPWLRNGGGQIFIEGKWRP